MSTRKWNAASVYCKAGILIGTVLMLAGCAATEPNRGLEEAKQSLNRAKQDQNIAKNAPVALYEAEQTINRANEHWEDGEDEEFIDHLAYMAKQQIKIAEANAQEKMSNDEFERINNDVMAKELAALKAQQTDRGMMVPVGDVLFQTGKADLKPGALQNLYRLVSFLKENPTRKVMVEGHTDSVGSSQSNQLLSERRAHSVANFLLSNGVEGSRLSDLGYGEEYPVDTNSTAAGRTNNRRVEVTILNEGQEPILRR